MCRSRRLLRYFNPRCGARYDSGEVDGEKGENNGERKLLVRNGALANARTFRRNAPLPLFDVP
jgi:hypothetical protein